MSRKSKRGGLEPLGAVIAKDREIRAPKTVPIAPVTAHDWEAAVGTRIAARTEPMSLERGVLLVRVATSTWANELTLLADAIVEELRRRRVRVEKLRFRVGEITPRARITERAPARVEPPAAKLPPEVVAELERIDDLDLRAAIARAASKSLGYALLPARTTRGPRAPAGGAQETAGATPPRRR